MNHKSIKSRYPALFILTLILLLPSTLLAADVYQIDPEHSSVLFRIKHLAISNVYGKFTDFQGTLKIDLENPKNNSIDAFILSKSIDTDTPKRDDHVRSPEFLNVEIFPKVSFHSKSWKQIDTDLFEVTGDLTLHGVTQPLTVKLALIGAAKDPWGGYRIGFETSFSIKRTDFKMGEMLEAVGNKVKITVAIEAIRE
jgi:polyisoprenoid-binding protein YceI